MNQLPPKMEEFNSLEFFSTDDDLRNLATDCLLQTGDFYIVPSPDSATMEIAVQDYLQHKFPFSPRGPPDRETNPGKYNFVVEVNSKDVHKKRFLFSHRLGRIYVDINCDFSIQFDWDHILAPNMFVRATVVFSDESQAQKRVEKCVQHFQESDAAGQKKHIAKNVLHSSRELDAQGVYYCGDPDVADSWYSVLVRFQRDSAAPCSHAFKFTCKNSCSTGINRRSISIIFTLEDESGYVHGRQTIGTRVCACPRRDMHKDEESEGLYKSGKKRVPSNQINPPPQPKQIKLENSDETLTLPPLPVVDWRTMEAGLKVMYAMMKQGLDHRQQNPQAVKKYTECIEAFSLVLDDLNDTEASPPK